MTGTGTEPGFGQDGPDPLAEVLKPATEGAQAQGGSDESGDGFERRMVTRAGLAGALNEIPGVIVLHGERAGRDADQIALDAAWNALPFAEPLREHEARWMVKVGSDRLAELARTSQQDGSAYRKAITLDLLTVAVSHVTPRKLRPETASSAVTAEAIWDVLPAWTITTGSTAWPDLAGGEQAEVASGDAVRPRTELEASAGVRQDPARGLERLSAAADGPGEYRLTPSTLQSWRVTRETAKPIAAWCLGSWERSHDGTVWVNVPTRVGPVTALEGWSVIRYGTTPEGAGLYWPVPPGLFEPLTPGALAEALRVTIAGPDGGDDPQGQVWPWLARRVLAHLPGGQQ